ncbi:MAG: hypothetical protein ACXV8I_09655 [Methylobacter sp.]
MIDGLAALALKIFDLSIDFILFKYILYSKLRDWLLTKPGDSKMKTVLLSDQTVGTTDQDVEIGDTVLVDLHDENGMPIQVEGAVEEILTEE